MADGDVTRLLHEVFGGEDAGASSWDGALFPGAVVGRFELVRQVGYGGFGAVWEARDRELNRRVALKAVERAGPGPTDAQALGEAEVTARLSHPNVVTLFDVGRCENGPYLVMELLSGRSLRDAVQDGPLPPEDAVRVAAQVARGLAHAHARGVLHGDLSPSNVFLQDDGGVKLLDLGLARLLATGSTGEPERGTPGFVPPERVKGEPEDARGDLFSLGAMLHWALTGRHVPPGATGAAAVVGLPGPEPLRALVARLLAADPAGRPPSAQAVAAELEALTPEGAEASARQAVVRRRNRAILGIAGLALAAGLVALAARSAREERARAGMATGEADLVVQLERPVLAVGETSPATAARRQDGGAGATVVPTTWWTSSAQVAVVDAAGRVKARGPGTAVIAASLGKASGNAAVTVPGPGWQLVSSSTLGPPPAGSRVYPPRESSAPVATYAFGRLAWAQEASDGLSVPLDLPEDTDRFAVQVDVRLPFVEGEEQGVHLALDSRGVAASHAAIKLQPVDRWRTVRLEGSLARCEAQVTVDGVAAGVQSVPCSPRALRVAFVAASPARQGLEAAWSNLAVFRGAPVQQLHLALARLPPGTRAYARGVATPLDAEGNPLSGRSVRWESSDPYVASVDAEGVVTARHRGRVTITARCEGKVASGGLEVEPAPGSSR